MASNQSVLAKTREYVKSEMEGEGTGHDWWHVVRVVNNAKAIAQKEGGDLLTVELAALLHDIADWKFHDGDSTIGAKKSQQLLQSLGVKPDIIDEVCYIVEHISFKGGTNKQAMRSLEGKIVQDADRLDALGAIGIARLFAYGGSVGREIYNPKFGPKQYNTFDSYKNTTSTSVNHFYEKVLQLKDKMNTKTGKAIAKSRHDFVQKYLDQFYGEWDGKR